MTARSSACGILALLSIPRFWVNAVTRLEVRGLASLSRELRPRRPVKQRIAQKSPRDVCQRISVNEYSSQKCRKVLDRLDRQGIRADTTTYAFFLRRCTSLSAGKFVHAHIISTEHELNVFLGNLLVTMYGKCGSIEDACSVFSKMRLRDVVSWNSMITAYVQTGNGNEVFQLFQQMQQEGVKPNKVTCITILNACANLAAVALGKMIHANVIEGGFESDVVVGTALLNMYGKCGNIRDARSLFDRMHNRNVVSWTAMIAAYAQHGNDKEALHLFGLMQREGVKPNKVTFSNVLGACASLKALVEGKMMHAQIVDGGLESDVVVGTALVNMYAKCGNLEDAQRVFHKMHQRDVVSWTAMIAAYAQQGHGKEAFQIFGQMKQEGVKPNKITFLALLLACADLTALADGKMVHASVVNGGFELDVVMGTALINMYSKCGSLEDARAMFDKMHSRDMITWNVMIAAYAQHGLGKESLHLFKEMQLQGMMPDEITFVSVLSACSHAGLVDDGLLYFVSMNKDYGIIPTVEHYGCLIDLFGRAGQLDEAENFINNMPVQPNAMVWKTLLGACKIYGDMHRGKRAAERIAELESVNSSTYVLLSSIYAANGRWEDVAKERSNSRHGCEQAARVQGD